MSSKRKVASEDLYRYTWVLDPAICPNSSTVAYVERSIDRERDEYRSCIRSVPLNGGESRTLTHGPKDEQPAWSNDGSLLLFVRASSQGRQVWSIPSQGGEARQLTFAAGGISGYALSPDGNYLVYTAKTKAEAEDGQQDKDKAGSRPEGTWRVIQRTKPKAEGAGLWDGAYTHLYMAELASGEVRTLAGGRLNISQPVWSPDSRRLLVLAKSCQDDGTDQDMHPFNDIYTLAVGDEPAELKKLTGSDLLIRSAEYGPDGSWIVFLGNDRRFHSATQDRLFRISSSGGAPVDLTGSFDGQPGHFALNETLPAYSGRSPLAGRGGCFTTVTEQGCVHVYRFGSDGTAQRCTWGERHVYQYALSLDGRYLVAAAATPYHPGELYRIDLQSKEEFRLTGANDALLQELDFPVPEELWAKTEDGCRLQGWILKPKTGDGQAPSSLPAVLYIHGGPHAMYSSAYHHEFQLYAAQGYAVVYANPRGSFGYGQEFAKACLGDLGGRDYHDLLDFLDTALELHPELDQSRLGVAGGSYGGFMANWIIGHTRRFRAAFTHRSISNWLSFYGTSDIGIEYTEAEIGANPWDDAAKLWERSPLAYLKAVEAPLLILHGEQDMRCPIGQAEELYVGLKRLGKVAELVRFPASNHSMLKSGKPSFRRESWDRGIAWFGRFLQEGGVAPDE